MEKKNEKQFRGGHRFWMDLCRAELVGNGLKEAQAWSIWLMARFCRKRSRKAYIGSVQFSSLQWLSHVRLLATPWIAAHQASLSITNSRSSLRLMSISQWCHPAISSSVIPCSSFPQSLPASEFFPMSQLFTWGGQSTGVSALASSLPMNTQDRSPIAWTGWISLQSKGLSGVFSNTTVQKHQFFGAQLSSQSNSHIHTWLLEKP